MNMTDPLNHLGSIWYHSETLEVSSFQNHFLGLDPFLPFLTANWLQASIGHQCNSVSKRLPPCTLYIFVWSFTFRKKSNLLFSFYFNFFKELSNPTAISARLCFCVKSQIKHFNTLEQQRQCAKRGGFDNSWKKEGK